MAKSITQRKNIALKVSLMLVNRSLMNRYLVLALVPMGLSGCGFLFGDNGYFRDRSMDYQNAKTISEVRLSEQMSDRIQPYPIPESRETGEQTYRPSKFKDVPRPESVISFYKDGSIQIRRDGKNDWVWVKQSRENLIDLVDAFWRENRIALDKKDVESGFIETVWVHQAEGEAGENLWEKSKSGWKKLTKFRQPLQKFRVNIVSMGGDANSKVLLSHATASAKKSKDYFSSPEDFQWISSSEKDEFHRLILQQLVDYLGSEKHQRTSLGLALNVEEQTRVVMNKDGNGFPVLVIKQDFNRAWETIGRSLEKGKVHVDDINRSLAIFYVGYPDEENEDELLVFEVKLSQGENGIHIAVQLDDETMAPIDVAEVLLSIIKSNV